LPQDSILSRGIPTERSRSISSPPATLATRQTAPAILKSFNIDIFYFAKRRDLHRVALSIQSEIVNRGLNKPMVKGYSTVAKIKDLDGTCQWSHIRYEQDEEDAARKLKLIVEKVAPKQTWNLLPLPEIRDAQPTPNYLSIFVEDEDSFKSAYSIYHQEQTTITQEADICEQQRQG
jgi:hypothetical protein